MVTVYCEMLLVNQEGLEILCALHCTALHMYSVQCTVYTVQCTVYSAQCTVYSVHVYVQRRGVRNDVFRIWLKYLMVGDGFVSEDNIERYNKFVII